jgi:galactokinase
MTAFEQVFGYPPEASGNAPGRVNMLGEHTDYNGGFVLPTIIPQRTCVAIAASRDGGLHVQSAQLGPADCTAHGAVRPTGFGRYVFGCLAVLRERGHRLPAISVHVDSDVPIGAGLSSSAALEVATLRALRTRFSLNLDDAEIARIAQEAEVRFAGVNCGIMDQMACSLGVAGQMLLLDTRSLERSLIPLPDGTGICVIDSGIPRSLAATAFNQRRSECEQAAQALGAESLRDVTDLALVAQLPPPLDRRARHVLTENVRVLIAAHTASPREFGDLMDASHASLRDDFEVSVPSLNVLVDCLQRHPCVFGARLTGAGFGGACVALVEPGSQALVGREVLAMYASRGYIGTQLV